MLIIFVLAIYIIIPYVFSSRNLISKNYDNCTYEEICILDSNSTEYSVKIKNNKEGKVDKLVKLIDGLTIKKTWKPKDLSTYGISFVATYKKEEGNTCTEEVFFYTVL